MFIQGHVYRRRDLHDQYGGQRQGGISTPSRYPVVMLFTGESGEQHGYADGWSADGLFFYTGEGQQGDMALVRGNAAIRDHVANGKDLHLFAHVKPGEVRYVGQMVCTGVHTQAGPDTTGHLRQMLIFELTPLSAFAEPAPSEATVPSFPGEETSLSLDDLRRKALADAVPASDPRARQTFSWQRSQWIKRYALRRANGQCEGCGMAAPFVTPDGQPYLEVHHIRRLSDGGPDHPRWVIAICPNCHRRAHYAEDAVMYNARLCQIAQAREAGRK